MRWKFAKRNFKKKRSINNGRDENDASAHRKTRIRQK